MLIKGNNLNKSRVAKFILKKEESSKPEIANELGLSMPTVLQIVKELTLSGLIAESGKYESTGGRKASVLSVVPEHRFSIGIDITANHISCVVIDLCGKIIHKTRVKSVFEDTQNYFDKAADRVADLLSISDHILNAVAILMDTVRPYDNTSADTVLFCGCDGKFLARSFLHRNSQFVSADRERNAVNICREIVIAKHTVCVGESSNILASVPFKLVYLCRTA